MLNKNLIKKSIAAAVAGAFVLSATAFAGGATATVARPAIEVKSGSGQAAAPGVTVAPVVPGKKGAAGVAAGSKVIKGETNQAGPSASAKAAVMAPMAVSGSVDAQTAQKAGIATKSNSNTIRESILRLNRSETSGSILTVASINALSSLPESQKTNVVLIVSALQEAVLKGTLTVEQVNLLAQAEAINAATFGETIINAAMVTAEECRQVWASSEAAGNLYNFVVRVANALKASGVTDLAKAQELYAKVGQRTMKHLNADTNLLLAKLTGAFGSSCQIDNAGPAKAAIDAANQSHAQAAN